MRDLSIYGCTWVNWAALPQILEPVPDGEWTRTPAVLLAVPSLLSPSRPRASPRPPCHHEGPLPHTLSPAPPLNRTCSSASKFRPSRSPGGPRTTSTTRLSRRSSLLFLPTARPQKQPRSRLPAMCVSVHTTSSGHLSHAAPQVPPPTDEPPLYAALGQDDDRGPSFQAHKAAFFFRLERELEKVRSCAHLFLTDAYTRHA